MAEQLIFDVTGDPYSTGSQLDVMASPYAVTAMSFPAPALDMAMAGSIDTEGDLVAARRHGNRPVSLTVEARGTSQTDLDTQLGVLNAKIAKVAQKGGTLRRVRADGNYRTLDLLAADGYEPAFDVTYFAGNVAVCNIGLQAKPYARAAATTLASHTTGATNSPAAALVFTETAIPGDVPAIGLLAVTDVGNVTQRTVPWGLQSDTYDTSSTATLYVPATTLGGPGTSVSSVSGSVNTNVYRVSQALTANASPTVVDIARIGFYTAYVGLPTWGLHWGSYRVIARMASSSTSAATISATLRWANGAALATDLSANPSVKLPAGSSGPNAWYLIDLGPITLPKPNTGIQAGWSGAITLSLFSTSTETVQVWLDYLTMIPLECANGQAAGQGTSSAAIAANQTLAIYDDRVIGYDPANTTLESPRSYAGDYLRVPPGDVRFIAQPTTGDVIQAPSWPSSAGSPTTNPTGSKTSAQLTITPRYLTML